MNHGTRTVKLSRIALTSMLAIAVSWVSAQSTLPRVLAWEQTLRGTEGNELRWPVAVAAGSAEELTVADAFDPRLMVFRKVGPSWQLDRTVQLPGAPIGLAHDGNRYVLSMRGQSGLTAFEGAGLQQRRIGLPPGVVPGPLAAWNHGGLLVYDYAGERALKLSVEGKITGEFAINGHVTGVGVAPAGGFYATLGDAGAVLRFDANGKLDARWQIPGDGPVPAWPGAVVVEAAGELLVVDRHNDRVLVLGAAGQPTALGSRRGWEPGLLRFPSAIALIPDGGVLVADGGNGRVQIFRRTDRDSGN